MLACAGISAFATDYARGGKLAERQKHWCGDPMVAVSFPAGAPRFTQIRQMQWQTSSKQARYTINGSVQISHGGNNRGNTSPGKAEKAMA